MSCGASTARTLAEDTPQPGLREVSALMTTDDRDAQCLAILTGITELVDALSEPMVRQAVDLDRSNVSRRYDLLLRLKDSLAQYAARSVDLFYVGLLGHFSAGKSSTINSLLNLWGQSEQRPVDLH